MKETVRSVYRFAEAFREAGRGEQFSREGLDLLYDYICQFEDDTGEEVELDVIAFCCDFAEADFNEILMQDDSLDLDGSNADPLEDLCEQLRDKCGFAEYTSENTIIYRQY